MPPAPRQLTVLRGLVVVVAVVALTGAGPSRATTGLRATAEASSMAPAALLPDRLASDVGAAQATQHLVALQRIADEHDGNRAVGTAGYEASVDYVAATLQRAGFEVQTPTFDYDEEVVRARRLTVGEVVVRVDQLRRSADTATGGVSGPLVVLRGDNARGCAGSDVAGLPTNGAVLLVRRGGCTFQTKVDRAAAAGAVAVVVVNDADQPLRGATLGSASDLPVGGISRSDGDTLAGRAGQAATLDVRTDVETRTVRNVLAQTRTGRTDAVVVAGGHLDSVPAGPGINDNGSGTAGLLEVALRLGSAPDVADAVRFAWWGAEEVGLVGSSAYVDGLSSGERRDIALYLNVDMIASPNPGYFVYDGDDSAREGADAGPPGSAGIERTLTGYLSAHGVPSEPTDFDGRSDYGPFVRAGIPAGGLFSGAEEKKSARQASLWGGEAGASFDPCYHRACDTLDNLDQGAFEHHLDALAWTIGSYAAGALGPRPGRSGSVSPAVSAVAPRRRTRVVLGLTCSR
jgi:Zn-dependent M28 family amino/carboxypeptidase